MNPFENYTPPAVEDILSDEPRFIDRILELKQLRIAAENCQALLKDGTLEDVLAGKEAYEYTRPVADLQKFGNFGSREHLMSFVTQGTFLGMAEAMGVREIPSFEGTAMVHQKYDDSTDPQSGTIQIKIDK